MTQKAFNKSPKHFQHSGGLGILLLQNLHKTIDYFRKTEDKTIWPTFRRSSWFKAFSSSSVFASCFSSCVRRVLNSTSRSNSSCKEDWHVCINLQRSGFVFKRLRPDWMTLPSSFESLQTSSSAAARCCGTEAGTLIGSNWRLVDPLSPPGPWRRAGRLPSCFAGRWQIPAAAAQSERSGGNTT